VSRGFPAAPSDNDWSATQARTVGTGRSVVTAEAGWPGIAAQYLYGLDAATDIGGRVAFNYGFVNTTIGQVGVDLQVPVRRFLTTSGAFDIEAHASPGLTFYGNHGEPIFGIGGPIGLLAAYHVDPRFTVDVAGEVPILLSLSNPTGLFFGPLVGAGAEYQLEKNLSLTAKVRVGPEFAVGSGGSGSQFAFQTIAGVAYALR
jgi:opacity protein-like surface antigen